LDSDEDEVEDLHVTWKIEEILHTTYERKTICQGSDAEEGSPFHTLISVEPTTPCLTKTSEEEEELVRQQVTSSRSILVGQWSNSNGRKTSSSNSQLS
jgi:hypothetical protein